MTDIRQDLLWGCRAIAEYTGQGERKTSYRLERGLLPAGKVGAQWVASKSALDDHFRRLTAAARPDTDT